MKKIFVIILVLASVIGFSGRADAADKVPAFAHEVVILLENHSYNQVVDSPNMPYLNTLIKQYGLGADYFANTHPSIGNYFMLTTGRIPTRDDNFTGVVKGETIVNDLAASGRSWKAYAEGLPKAGYIGGNVGRYLKRHNPFAYFDSVRKDPKLAVSVVPFSTFSKDVRSGRLPNFSFIIPDACDDAHDCSLLTADKWLKQNIAPLVSDKSFMKDGLIAVVFDEGKATDKTHGGGQDPVVLVGNFVKAGYRSTVFYQHQNLLRTLLDGLAVARLPGAAAKAAPMTDFFKP